jgi:hypothetical protein
VVDFNLNKHISEIKTDIICEDKRYPILILESESFGVVGYAVDISSGKLDRVCICAAHNTAECVCGAWS